MNWDKINKVYFLGIGGIGMSALAFFALNQRRKVAGYDRVESEITQRLSAQGVVVHYTDDVKAIPREFTNPDDTLVIYTPAIPADHQELNWFKHNGFKLIKRAAFLGMISQDKYVVATAGTHGKTSITSTISWIMAGWEQGVNAFIGGISKNFDNNFIEANSIRFVLEADEFDRSFLNLYPDVAVITAIDPDHLDIYGDLSHLIRSFNDFVSQIKPGGVLLYKKGLEKVLQIPETIRAFSYATDRDADFSATHISTRGIGSTFDVLSNGELLIESLKVNLPGLVNVENSLAAILAAHFSGVPLETIHSRLMEYKGVKRRFDLRINTPSLVYIDDYAHHPEEIRATLHAVQSVFPGKRITVLFQPHLFSRTRDFADDFAVALDIADECFLLEIYPAREKPIPGVDSRLIASKMKNNKVAVIQKNEVEPLFGKLMPEVLLTLGAGDIDRLVEPLTQMFISKLNG